MASLAGGEPPKRLLPDLSPIVFAASPDPKLGYLLFVRGGAMPLQASGTLMAQAIQPRTQALVGEAVPVAEQVAATGFSASATGVLVYGTGSSPLSGPRFPGMVQGQLTWFDRQGKLLSTVGEPGVYRVLAISPDNKRVALEAVDSQRTGVDIWIFEFARGTNTRFTFGGINLDPVWSRDSTRIIYWSQRGRGNEWLQKAANGAGDDELIFKTTTGGGPRSWSPDGRFVLYNDTQQPADIWAVDLAAGPSTDRKPIPLVNSPFNDINARFSPDGKWLSYASNETGTYEIYVRAFNPKASGTSPSNGGKWMVSKGGSNNGGAMWRADGKELFYLRQDQTLMSVEVSTDPVFAAGVPKELFKTPPGVMFWDVTPDGRRFLLPVTAGAGASTPPYKVVLNWTSTLKK